MGKEGKEERKTRGKEEMVQLRKEGEEKKK